MKKILLTIARWFHVDLTEIKYVEVEKVVEKIVEKTVEKQVALGGLIEGDVMVKGDIVVDGFIFAYGGLSCLGACANVDEVERQVAMMKEGVAKAKMAARKRNEKGQFVKED